MPLTTSFLISTTVTNAIKKNTDFKKCKDGNGFCKLKKIYNYWNITYLFVWFQDQKEDSCSDYYVCSHSNTADEKIENFSCPSGLHFDLKLKTCNWPKYVDCKNNKLKPDYKFSKKCSDGDGLCQLINYF